MSKTEQIKCNQCLDHFTAANSAFFMPGCDHNICAKCLHDIWQSQNGLVQCEFCVNSIPDCKDINFKENFNLMKKIKAGLVNQQVATEPSNSRNQSFKISSGSTLQDQGCNLLDELTSSPAELVVKQSSLMHGICLIHEKSLQIICTTDLQMICPHCAIFGNHKDHKFKTVREFNKDLEDRCEMLQMIKQQKYISDKKINDQDLKEQFDRQIKLKKKQLADKIEQKFLSLIEEIQKAQERAFQQLDINMESISKEVRVILQQENKAEKQYKNWENDCDNTINKIEQGSNSNERISLLYGSLTKIDQGTDILAKLQKRNQVLDKKINNLLNSVSLEITRSFNFGSWIKINRKSDDKRQSFMAMIEKISIPHGKHTVDEVEDFTDNSFMCDFSREDLSLILDGQMNKSTSNIKKTAKKQNPLNQTTLLKATSPSSRKIPNNATSTKILTRCKSNNTLFDEGKKQMINSSTASKRLQNSRTVLKKDAEVVVQQFIKQDLKEVLDLSACNLDDQNIYGYLKEVRRTRKMRGVKLSQNQISDAGFSRILQLLNSTSNLNLSYNKMSEQVLNLLIKHRDKFAPLRIINLSFNQVNEKKARVKIDALKKMGIIVNI